MAENDSSSRSRGLPEPGQFDSVGEWFNYVRSEGYNVPVQVPHAISLAQSELGLSAQQAFDWLKNRRLLAVGSAGVIVNLRANRPEFWQQVREAGGEYDPDAGS